MGKLVVRKESYCGGWWFGTNLKGLIYTVTFPYKFSILSPPCSGSLQFVIILSVNRARWNGMEKCWPWVSRSRSTFRLRNLSSNKSSYSSVLFDQSLSVSFKNRSIFYFIYLRNYLHRYSILVRLTLTSLSQRRHIVE